MNFWNRHLEEVGESYFEHARVAITFAGKMFYGACVCTIHAVFPFLFERSGSSIVKDLHNEMVLSRLKSQRITNSYSDKMNA